MVISDEKIEFLLKLQWWNWSEEEIFDNLEMLKSEAEFSLMFVKANAGAEDKYYIAGHVFRIISCLNQVLFACNNAYCINEKKAIKLLETFEYKPEKYAERVNHIFEVLGLSLFECYDMTEKLYKEVKKIATEINNFLYEGNSDERKQI